MFLNVSEYETHKKYCIFKFLCIFFYKLNLFKVKEITEAFVNCQNELEKSARDKISLMAELEAAKSKLDNFDIDYGQVC